MSHDGFNFFIASCIFVNHSVNLCHYFYSYDTDWTLISIWLSLEMVINMRCAKKLVYCGLVFQLIAFFSDMNVKKRVYLKIIIAYLS